MTTQPTSGEAVSSAGAEMAGVLLVHGFRGSVGDMVEVEEVLHKNGFVTRNLPLPGHGSQTREMLLQGWPEWAAAVQTAYQSLRKQCGRVFLIGHSLGGALCLQIAAHEEVAGIVSMCAPISIRAWLRPLVQVGKCVLPLLPAQREDGRNSAECRRRRRNVYRWSDVHPVESMMKHLPVLRTELPRITAPALIMVSRRDPLVPASDGREIYRCIGSSEKYFVTFHHSYHVIMKDQDREEVFAKTEAFVLRHARHVRRDPF